MRIKDHGRQLSDWLAVRRRHASRWPALCFVRKWIQNTRFYTFLLAARLHPFNPYCSSKRNNSSPGRATAYRDSCTLQTPLLSFVFVHKFFMLHALSPTPFLNCTLGAAAVNWYFSLRVGFRRFMQKIKFITTWITTYVKKIIKSCARTMQ